MDVGGVMAAYLPVVRACVCVCVCVCTAQSREAKLCIKLPDDPKQVGKILNILK
jgi:hypothetical protein